MKALIVTAAAVGTAVTASARAGVVLSAQIDPLGTLGGAWSEAFGINEQGQVVGWSEAAGGRILAFVWFDGVMSPLHGLPGALRSRANDINELGQIVAAASTAECVAISIETNIAGIVMGCPMMAMSGNVSQPGGGIPGLRPVERPALHRAHPDERGVQQREGEPRERNETGGAQGPESEPRPPDARPHRQHGDRGADDDDRQVARR